MSDFAMSPWTLLGERVLELQLQSTLLLAVVLLLLLWLRAPAARRVLARTTLLGLLVLPGLELIPGWPRCSAWLARPQSPPHEVAGSRVVARYEAPAASDDAGSIALPSASSVPPSEEASEVREGAADHAPVGRAATGSLPPAGAPVFVPGSSVSSSWQPAEALLVHQAPAVDWRSVVAWLAVGASSLALGWNLLGAWLAWRLVRSAAPAPEWLYECGAVPETAPERVRFLVSERVRSALVIGVGRPVILLPRRLLDAGPTPALNAVLRHELAHVAHGDLWWLMGERSVQVLYALQPLLWPLRRTIRLDQELLADAAAAGEAPVEYAEALVAWVKSAAGPAPLSALPGFSSGLSYHAVSRRLTMLLESPRLAATRVTWRWRAGVAVLVFALAVSLSLVSLRPSDSTAQEKASSGAALPATAAPAVGPSAGRAAAAPVDSPGPTGNELGPGVVPAAPPPPRRQGDLRRETRAVELGSEAVAGETSAVPHVVCEIIALRLDRRALDGPDDSLEERIIAASEERCRLERRAIVAPMRAPKFQEFLQQLEAAGAAKVLCRPRVTTVLNKPATLLVGGEIPLVEVREFDGVTGQVRPPQLEWRAVGLQVEVTVRSQPQEEHLLLDFCGVHSALGASPAPASAVKVLDTFRLQLTQPVAIGETLVILCRDGGAADAAAAPESLRPDLLFAVQLVELRGRRGHDSPQDPAPPSADSSPAPRAGTVAPPSPPVAAPSPTAAAVTDWQFFLPHPFPADALTPVVRLKWQCLVNDAAGEEELVDCESNGCLLDTDGTVLAMMPLDVPVGNIQLRVGDTWHAARLKRQDSSTGLAFLEVVAPIPGFPGRFREVTCSSGSPQAGQRVVLPGTRRHAQLVVSSTVEGPRKRDELTRYYPKTFFNALWRATDKSPPFVLLRSSGRDSGPVFSEQGEVIGFQVDTLQLHGEAGLPSRPFANSPPSDARGPCGLLLPASEVLQAIGRLLEAVP